MEVIKRIFRISRYKRYIRSKRCIKEAIQRGNITDGKVWFEVLEARKFIPETYKYEVAKKMFQEIKGRYVIIFYGMCDKLEAIMKNLKL